MGAINKLDYQTIRNRIYLQMAIFALSHVTTHTEESIKNEEFHAIEEKLHKWMEKLSEKLKIKE